MKTINDTDVKTLDYILLQASSLAQLTRATNQLTRDTCVGFLIFLKFTLLPSTNLDECIKEMLVHCFCIEKYDTKD